MLKILKILILKGLRTKLRTIQLKLSRCSIIKFVQNNNTEDIYNLDAYGIKITMLKIFKGVGTFARGKGKLPSYWASVS